MQQLLQQLDPDFYRETRLHIARVELEQLRQDRSAFADIERRSKIPLGIFRLGDVMTARNR
jgi:DNA replication initiation complex subunit (GINS family)